MDQYRINDLERLTGIKAHTIRIWEKRYLLIKPSRTQTNRRFYTGAELVKLMNVSTLINNGYKISTVAALSESDLQQLVEKVHHHQGSDDFIDAYLHELTVAMIELDELTFTQTYENAIAKYGFYQSMIQLFYPFLINTGLMWRIDKTTPAQEHFVSNLIRSKLIAATDDLGPIINKEKRMVLFLPPAEWHDVGLLFANYILKVHGWQTYYLGQNVPYDNLQKVSSAVQPNALFCFFITPKPKEEIEQELAQLAQSVGDTNIYISGNRELLQQIVLPSTNIKILKDIDGLLNIL